MRKVCHHRSVLRRLTRSISFGKLGDRNGGGDVRFGHLADIPICTAHGADMAIAQEEATLVWRQRFGCFHHDGKLTITEAGHAAPFFASSMAAIGSGCQRLIPRSSICRNSFFASGSG